MELDINILSIKDNFIHVYLCQLMKHAGWLTSVCLFSIHDYKKRIFETKAAFLLESSNECHCCKKGIETSIADNFKSNLLKNNKDIAKQSSKI